MNCDEDRDVLEEVFGPGITPLNTGIIQQTISTTSNGKLLTLKSPDECGTTVVKFETYNLRNIVGMDRNQWWSEAIMLICLHSFINCGQEMIISMVTK